MANTLTKTIRMTAIIIAVVIFAGCGENQRNKARRAELLEKLSSDMVAIPYKEYCISKYEVTQELWKSIMGKNPSHFQGDDNPVESITEEDISLFFAKLNTLNSKSIGVDSEVVYRLPTPSEWRDACLAGAEGEYCRISDEAEITDDTLDEVAWYGKNSGNQTHPVGQKKPNAFGLYDMLGNVEEWTRVLDKRSWKGCWSGSSCNSSKVRISNDKEVPYSGNASRGFRIACSRALSDDERRTVSERIAARRKKVLSELDSNMVDIPEMEYAICKTEVIQDLWETVMDVNPSKNKGENLPVDNVDLKDCCEFIRKLNAFPEVKKAGVEYRLPTPCEWEYACMAGARSGYCKLQDGTEVTMVTLDDVAWFYGNSDRKTHPVGQKQPNAFGLYDMLGNVSECLSMSDFFNWKYGYIGGSCVSLVCDASAIGYAHYWRLYDAFGLRYDQAEEGTAGFRLARSRTLSDSEQYALSKKTKRIVENLAASMIPIPGKEYALCKFEVTQDLWETIMGDNPSYSKGNDLPVEKVSWEDCLMFLLKLNALPDVKSSGISYRLPSASEWSYACRAGTESPWGIEPGTVVSDVAWFDGNSGATTHPVGLKKPNKFGLYDMLGNVSEWTASKLADTLNRDESSSIASSYSYGNEGMIRNRYGGLITRGGDFLSQFDISAGEYSRQWYKYCMENNYDSVEDNPNILPTGQYPESRHAFLGFRLACDIHK